MPEDNIISLIANAARMYRTNLNNLFVRNHIDLTAEMYLVMRELWKQDGKRLWELAEVLHKDKGAITKVVDNLEKRKLLFRVTDAGDKRNKQLLLTTDGVKLKAKVMPLVEELYSHSIATISEHKLEQSKQILNILIGRLS
jgi:DNA-binding MarR family transcriptional regulator